MKASAKNRLNKSFKSSQGKFQVRGNTLKHYNKTMCGPIPSGKNLCKVMNKWTGLIC